MKLLTVKEVAELLGVRRSTLYQWAETDKIPCCKINGLLRFSQEEILSWIKACKREPNLRYNPPASRRPGKGG
jgi:excisionase family DNA binding protein